MRHSIPLLLACVVLVGSHRTIAAQEKAPDRVAALRKALLQADSDRVLVVAHRGDWRHAPENSIRAIENCIRLGVDMVEIDVRRTKDGKLVVIHDKTLDRTTTGKGKVADHTLAAIRRLHLRNGANHPTHHRVPTLEEALRAAKGRILVNLDKCYGYFDQVFPLLESTGTLDQVIIKGNVKLTRVRKDFGRYLDRVIFMPIVRLNKPGAQNKIDDYQRALKPVAFEITFRDERSPLLRRFRSIRARGSRVWVNTLWASLNAGYEDDCAVDDPDAVYGWLIERGVNMIQTDRPRLLLSYLRKKKLHL